MDDYIITLLSRLEDFAASYEYLNKGGYAISFHAKSDHDVALLFCRIVPCLPPGWRIDNICRFTGVLTFTLTRPGWGL